MPKTVRVERPTARVRQPLSLRKVELGLLVFFDVEVDPNELSVPAHQCSIP